MPFVTNEKQIIENVLTLASYDNPNNPTEKSFHDGLMRRGRVFVALTQGGKTLFAPSRFAGYQNKTMETHQPGNRGHGTRSNNAIDLALKQSHTENQKLDSLFLINWAHIPPINHTRQYWELTSADFSNNAETLAGPAVIESGSPVGEDSSSATQREQLDLARIGQGRFRDSLLSRWSGKCAVTSCSQMAVLRASHMKPWCDADDRERLCQENGLLLAAHLDALFDAGLISFANTGEMLISTLVTSSDRKSLGLREDMRLREQLTEAEVSFLEYHRTTHRKTITV